MSVGGASVICVRRETLRKAEARRIALAAQGFGVPRPDRPLTMRDVQAVTNRLAQFQIDSINVVKRAHFMPLFSRLGPYDPTLIERAAYQAPRRLFEYWGHAASLIDVSLQPLLRFRMQPGFRDVWAGVERVARENADLIPFVRDEVAARGPISARDLEIAEERDRTNWGWNWSRVKTVLEWLFYVGEVTSAYRNSQFERVYDLPERVIPGAVLAVPTPTPQDSVTGLIRRAARGLGIASESGLRDYFRTRVDMTRVAIATLVENGELIPVVVAESGNRALVRVASGADAASHRRPGAVEPVRFDDLRTSAAGAPLRLCLPHRDLRAGAETRPRLLRLSLPPG